MSYLKICDICHSRIGGCERVTCGHLLASYPESWMEDKHFDLCEDCLCKVLDQVEKLQKERSTQIAYAHIEEVQNENNP